jgi:glyoxylase-like metal-dependent hydrolase (beta-lactamase superfamily II)
MPPVNRISRLGFVNCYLVDEEDGFTLVDTTLARSGKRILEAARDLGKPIVRVALTHAHVDHVGSVDELMQGELSGAELLISSRDARFLEKDMSLDPGEPVGSLEVIASPGHTPGHVAFLDPRDGTLYCGDTFSTLGGVSTTAKINWRFPLPTMATWHRPLVIESARALRDLNPSRLAPGHGKVVESPAAAMDKAIAAAAR